MLKTSLCDLLGIDYPILNAPMSGTATADLAVAVSLAGGLGMIGGTTRQGAGWLRDQIRAVRVRTDRPFGVGFISSFANTDELVEVALKEKVSVINHSFADPTPYVAAAHARGVKVFAQVQTVSQAARAAAANVDAIIAQGTEAGGHTGLLSTLPFVPSVVDVVGTLPVIAAGGIADGRGLAAVLMLGAVGCSLGTRFVASKEWAGGGWEQHAVLSATADDTIRTSVYDRIREAAFPAGIADRVLRNAFNSKWQGRVDELEQRRDELRVQLEDAARCGDADTSDVSAGVSAGLVSQIESAGIILRKIVIEAERTIRQQTTGLLIE